MTNGQIVAALNTINKIKESNRTLPIKLSFALNKNGLTLLDAYKPYEETLKAKGLTDLTEDKLAKLSNESKAAFVELYNTDVDIDLYKVSLKDMEGADLTINEMEIIQLFMLKDD